MNGLRIFANLLYTTKSGCNKINPASFQPSSQSENHPAASQATILPGSESYREGESNVTLSGLSNFKCRKKCSQSVCLRLDFDCGMLEYEFVAIRSKYFEKTGGVNLQWMQFPTCQWF